MSSAPVSRSVGDYQVEFSVTIPPFYSIIPIIQSPKFQFSAIQNPRRVRKNPRNLNSASRSQAHKRAWKLIIKLPYTPKNRDEQSPVLVKQARGKRDSSHGLSDVRTLQQTPLHSNANVSQNRACKWCNWNAISQLSEVRWSQIQARSRRSKVIWRTHQHTNVTVPTSSLSHTWIDHLVLCVVVEVQPRPAARGCDPREGLIYAICGGRWRVEWIRSFIGGKKSSSRLTQVANTQ